MRTPQGGNDANNCGTTVAPGRVEAAIYAWYHINALSPPFMQAPTAQTIERYLHDLAFDQPHQRLKREFMDRTYTQQDAFIIADNQLRGAYFDWRDFRNAIATLTQLENAKDICEERLYSEYLSKYNIVVSYLKGRLSRSGTPVQDQGAHLHQLLLRCRRCG